MFGGDLQAPKYVKHHRPNPMVYDIQLPAVQPGAYGHVGRAPNTDYHVRLADYKRKLVDAHAELVRQEAQRILAEKVKGKYDRHAEKVLFKKDIEERFRQKLQVFDEAVERRREKLKDILCKEERDYYYETIEQAQRGAETRMEDMKIKAAQLKAKREAERLEIVKEKRMQQFIDACAELRPVVAKHNLLDSKNIQLIQMKENEEKKEAEKELHAMWYNAMLKEKEAMMDRERQDLLKADRTKNEMMDVLQRQVRAKELAKQEADEISAEDRIEMLKLQEEMRREKIEELDAKRRKRDQRALELKEQIALQERFLAQRQKEEKALDDAFTILSNAENERERQKIQNTAQQSKREMAIYRQSLRELERDRQREEEELNSLLDEHRRAIEKKQDEAKCKLQRAREELQKNVLQGRAEQLEYKRREAEQQLSLKEAENELLRMACETNERLQAERDRLQHETVVQYRVELKKQIEKDHEKRVLEKDTLQRELAEGLAEEEHRRRIIEQLNLQIDKASQTKKHPFLSFLESGGCKCPPKFPAQH